MKAIPRGTFLLVLLLAGSLPLATAQQPPARGDADLKLKVAAEAPEIGRYGGTFVTSQTSEPRTLNPLLSTDTATGAVVAPVFHGLVEQNPFTGEIEPALAESWTVTNGGRVWTFLLREGVRWSDGRPLTIEDVLFSLEAVFTRGVASTVRDQLTFGDRPVRWRKVDDRRIQFITEEPVGLFIRLIGALTVVPQHKLRDALARGPAVFNATWGVNTPPREIIGTGPYVMQSYAFGERIIYLRNTNYWKVDRSGNRLPYLTRYVILFVPNVDAARLKFLAKDTDVYGARPREFAELKQGETAGNYTVYDGPETFSIIYLMFNQNPRGLAPPKLSWFQDVRFRRAVNHAIDRNTIITQIYTGRATAAWGPVSVGNTLYYNSNVPQYPYDLNRAQQLLGEAGYRRGGDGVLRDAQGNVVEFTLNVPVQNTDLVNIATIVRQDLTRLGMRVTLAPEPFNNVTARLDTFRWEAVMIGYTQGIEPATSRTIWMSSGLLHDWNPKQETPATEWEAEIDRIFEQAAREVDQQKRRQLYLRFQEIIAQQVPMMPFAYLKTQPAVRSTLGNIKIGLQGSIGRLEWRYYRQAYR